MKGSLCCEICFFSFFFLSFWDTWWSQSASHRRLTALKRATHPQHCTVGVQVRPCGAARGAVHSGAPPGYLGSPTRCQQLPVSGGDKQSCLWMRPSVSWRAEWPHVTASALESSLHRSRTLACESCLAHWWGELCSDRGAPVPLHTLQNSWGSHRALTEVSYSYVFHIRN